MCEFCYMYVFFAQSLKAATGLWPEKLKLLVHIAHYFYIHKYAGRKLFAGL